MPGKCPSTAAEYIAGTPIVGSLSFRTLALIIGWICFGITSVLWVALIIPHFRRYNSPHEQRQIFRIVTTPLIYSLFGLVSIYAYHAAPYLEPVPELYEAYALASLFMLYVHYAAPDTSSREEFFRNVKGMSKGREKPEGSLRHFRVSLQQETDISLTLAVVVEDHISLRAALYHSIPPSRDTHRSWSLLLSIRRAQACTHMGM